MPVFEYHCQSCDREFELLVGVGAGNGSLKCPHCGSDELKKLFSKFSARSKGSGGVTTPASGSSCGGCSSSNCGSCS